MIFHDIQQNTPEWDELRMGRITLSKFGCIAANMGKSFGEPAKKYAVKVALEQKKGQRIEDLFQTSYFDRGHELEPLAREEYERKTFSIITNGGFCIHSKHDSVGGSPDGFVEDENGGIEIKSVIYNIHYNNIKRGTFDPSYKWQLIGQMWLCDTDFVDYISYCPEYSKGKELYTHRLKREDYKDEISALDERIIKFIDLVDEIKKTL